MRQAVFLYRSLCYDFKRVFFSKSFLLAVFVIMIVNALSVLNEIAGSMWQAQSSAFYYFDVLVLEGTFRFVTYTAAVFPSISMYIGDIKYRNLANLLSRETSSVYIKSKVITTALSAFITVIIAQVVTFAVLQSIFPLEYDNTSSTVSVLEYILGSVFIQNGISVFWATFALVVSSFIPNIFVALASPLLFYYLFSNTVGTILPFFLRIGTGGFYANIMLDALYVLVYYIAICVALGIVFSKRVRRQLENGRII